MNTRMLVTGKGNKKKLVWWGRRSNTNFYDIKSSSLFHQELKIHMIITMNLLSRFKSWCDEYFITSQKESRGVKEFLIIYAMKTGKEIYLS